MSKLIGAYSLVEDTIININLKSIKSSESTQELEWLCYKRSDNGQTLLQVKITFFSELNELRWKSQMKKSDESE